MTATPYLRRLIDGPLAELLSQLPALLIVGPRAAGKTTTARRLARRLARLDVPAEAAAFRFDADAALSATAEPVLLDEWQEVPELMGALRRAVDEDPRPGRFLLTGTARARRGSDAWSGIGRVINVTLHGLSVRETIGGPARQAWLDTCVDQLVTRDAEALDGARDPVLPRRDLRGAVSQHGGTG